MILQETLPVSRLAQQRQGHRYTQLAGDGWRDDHALRGRQWPDFVNETGETYTGRETIRAARAARYSPSDSACVPPAVAIP